MTKTDSEDEKEHELYLKNKAYLDIQTNFMADFLDDLLAQGYDFLIVTSAGNANNRVFEKYFRESSNYDRLINANYKEVGVLERGRLNGINAQYNNAFTNISSARICYDNIICVGAISLVSTGKYDLARYSNIGDRVDILAPGQASTTTIRGTSTTQKQLREGFQQYRELAIAAGDTKAESNYDIIINNINASPELTNYATVEGTSFSAAYVTGAITLAYSVNPNISAKDMKQALIDSARNENLGTNVLDVASLIRTIRPYDLEYGMLSGNITCFDTGIAPTDAHICVFDVNNHILVKDFSVNDGFYELSLKAGVYRVTCASIGYMQYSSEDITVSGDSFFNVHDVILQKTSSSTGILRIIVKDDSGNPVPNADVLITGMTGTQFASSEKYYKESLSYGETVDYQDVSISTQSDENGEVLCQVPAGGYFILAEKDTTKSGFRMLGNFSGSEGKIINGLEQGQTRDMVVTLTDKDPYNPIITMQIIGDDGEYINDAKVTLYSGIDPSDDDIPVMIVDKDLSKIFAYRYARGWTQIRTAPGFYTVKIEKDGYETEYRTVLAHIGMYNYQIRLNKVQESEELPNNVYFENGQFNSTLAYPYTNIYNKTVTEGDFNNFNNGGGSVTYNIVKNNIGNGKIFVFRGTDSGDYVLKDGNIVCDISSPDKFTMDSFGEKYSMIWLPVQLPENTYTKMFCRLKLSTELYDGYSVHFYQAYTDASNNRMRTSAFAYDRGDIVDVSFDLETSDSAWTDKTAYIAISTGGFQHTEIQKIWFE